MSVCVSACVNYRGFFSQANSVTSQLQLSPYLSLFTVEFAPIFGETAFLYKDIHERATKNQASYPVPHIWEESWSIRQTMFQLTYKRLRLSDVNSCLQDYVYKLKSLRILHSAWIYIQAFALVKYNNTCFQLQCNIEIQLLKGLSYMMLSKTIYGSIL